jgi:hypothetical protein
MTLSIKGLFLTQSSRAQTPLCLAHYAECRILFIIMLSVILLNVVMLSVVAPTSSPPNVWHQLVYQSGALSPRPIHQPELFLPHGALPKSDIDKRKFLETMGGL